MSIKDYWKLFSPEFIPMAITTALLGTVITTSSLPNYNFLILTISIICVICAFNSYNAIADKEIDKINRLDRPIPSKKISEKKALKIAILLYFLALIFSLIISLEAFGIILISIIITIAYSFPKIHLKKHFVIGTLSVAFFYASLCFALGWALTPTNRFPIEIMVFLFIMGSGLSITKDFMDFSGDSFNGAKTLPVKLGYNKSITIIIAIITLAFLYLYILINQFFIEEKFLVLLIFYPLIISNVFLFKKYSKTFESNGLFVQIMILIIVLELGYIFLELI